MEKEIPSSRDLRPTPTTAAIAPLCEAMAIPSVPVWGAGGVRTKVNGMPSMKLTMPRQFGPSRIMPCSSSDCGKLLLLGAPLGAALRESRGEYDDPPNSAAAAGGYAFEHAGAGNGEHRTIHPMRKRIDRRQARSAMDLRALWVDQMKIACKARIFQIGQDACSER